MVHGQVPGGGGVPVPTVMVRPAEGVSIRRLSSVARVRIVRVPLLPGVNVYDQEPRPVAGCHEVPLSVETSTPPTLPPPAIGRGAADRQRLADRNGGAVCRCRDGRRRCCSVGAGARG